MNRYLSGFWYYDGLREPVQIATNMTEFKHQLEIGDVNLDEENVTKDAVNSANRKIISYIDTFDPARDDGEFLREELPQHNIYWEATRQDLQYANKLRGLPKNSNLDNVFEDELDFSGLSADSLIR